MGIYMSSNINYLLLLYLSRKVLRRLIGLQTFKRDIFAGDVCITPFSFSIIIINISGHVNAHDN